MRADILLIIAVISAGIVCLSFFLTVVFHPVNFPDIVWTVLVWLCIIFTAIFIISIVTAVFLMILEKM